MACMDWPRDRWLSYVGGYWKAADVIFERVVETGRDQDMLVYPYLMCWRHFVELQLKNLILLSRKYLGPDLSAQLPRGDVRSGSHARRGGHGLARDDRAKKWDRGRVCSMVRVVEVVPFGSTVRGKAHQ